MAFITMHTLSQKTSVFKVMLASCLSAFQRWPRTWVNQVVQEQGRICGWPGISTDAETTGTRLLSLTREKQCWREIGWERGPATPKRRLAKPKGCSVGKLSRGKPEAVCMILCIFCLDIKSNCWTSLENTIYFSSHCLNWLKEEEEFELMLTLGILLVL